MRHRLWICLGLAVTILGGAAQAATATFSSTDPDAVWQSVDFQAADKTGYGLDTGEVITFSTDTPFATTIGDSITVYHYSTAPFGTLFSIRWGYRDTDGTVLYRSGPFVDYSTTGDSSTISWANWSCAAYGGCNFIEITGISGGLTVDAIAVNGTMVSVAAPTPEPGTWVLMALGFVGIGYQLKRRRRARKEAVSYASLASSSSVNG